MKLSDLPCELYRQFDKDGQLLYVGISVCALVRMERHKSSSAWFKQVVRVEIERFPSRREALKAEQEALRNEKPLFNIMTDTRKGTKCRPAEIERKRSECYAKAESMGIRLSKHACLDSLESTVSALERGDYAAAKISSAWTFQSDMSLRKLLPRG